MKIIKKTLKWIVVAFFASTILSVVALRFMPVVVTPLMLIRCYEQVKAGEELKLSHDWEPLTNISKDLPIAVMTSEDAKFLEHHGFDYQAIEHAAKRNRQHPEKRKLGASTISQQTAKNVFLWPGRSWVRKGFEVYFTALIELMWPKERIMEVYLNFNTDAKDLTKAQCALIAATLPNPRKFSSKNPSAYMLKRQKRILREMKYVERMATSRTAAN